MLVFHDAVDHRLRAREPTARERVWACLLARRLDRALAAGVSPEGSALLALRAQALVRSRVRHRLACALQRILSEATEPPQRRSPARVPVRRDTVRGASEGIEGLIHRLLAPAPVSAAGVAQVLLLATDGTVPLYHRGSVQDLSGTIEQAVTSLDPLSTW